MLLFINYVNKFKNFIKDGNTGKAKELNNINLAYFYIFSPNNFFHIVNSRKDSHKIAWLVFAFILLISLCFFISISPTITNIVASVFQEYDLKFSEKFNISILVILLLLGTVQIVATIFTSFYILHITSILFGGKSTARQFFQNYILAMIPLGIKFIILTLFAVTIGSDFSFSYIDSLNKSSFSLLTNLLIDPFFWWSSILGCIALKESNKLSYMKSIMIISLLFLLGLSTVMLFNLI